MREQKYLHVFSNSGHKHGTAYCLGLLGNCAETPCVADGPSVWQPGYGEQLNVKHSRHTPNLSRMQTQLEHWHWGGAKCCLPQNL